MNEAFLLKDPMVLDLYKTEYAKTADLYYAGMVPFDSILERIRLHFNRL